MIARKVVRKVTGLDTLWEALIHKYHYTVIRGTAVESLNKDLLEKIWDVVFNVRSPVLQQIINE